ncbi:MAG: TetR/AcrR family transcriptional regulator [Chloroflexi bacterium]|nr:TetR/AcrR family transcriptional regulator [Chloroflexota bacterium]
MSRNNLSTRDQILDAAASLIRNIGLGHTTTKEIASAAGLSEAALYRHFVDKAELFLCVVGERLPQLVAALKDLPSRAGQRTVRSNLEDLARVALPFYDQTLPMATSLFAEPELLARHQEHMRQKNVGPHRSVEQLAAYVRAEQRLGRVNARCDPEAVAALLIGSCIGRALMRRFLGEQDSPGADDRFIKSVVRTLVEGLAPPTHD